MFNLNDRRLEPVAYTCQTPNERRFMAASAAKALGNPSPSGEAGSLSTLVHKYGNVFCRAFLAEADHSIPSPLPEGRRPG